MSRPCTVCRLPLDQQRVVDAALKSEASLEQISDATGISRSTLHRHRHHSAHANLGGTTFGEDGSYCNDRSLAAPSYSVPKALEQTEVAGLSIQSPIATREQLLEKIEHLFHEAIEGLEATKQPIRLKKPDGSVIELPGDLRVRPGFIREARECLSMLGAATGTLVAGPASGSVIIVMPEGQPSKDSYLKDVIDIAMPRRSRE